MRSEVAPASVSSAWKRMKARSMVAPCGMVTSPKRRPTVPSRPAFSPISRSPEPAVPKIS